MIALYQQLKRQILFRILSFILAIAICMLGLTNVANALTVSQLPSNHQAIATATDFAGDIFRNAYESRYTWDEQFPGYSAEVSVRYGKGLYHGVVYVNPDLSVKTAGINNEEVRQLVENQLQMEVTHRRRVPFATRHGSSTFELEGNENTGAVKIREVGDGMDSHYRVQDGKIIQVNRTQGNVAVTVDTLGFIKPPEGYLAGHFQTTFRDPQTGEVLEVQEVSDNYDKIGKYFLLSRRVIRTDEPGRSQQERSPDILIRFNDFQSLLNRAGEAGEAGEAGGAS